MPTGPYSAQHTTTTLYVSNADSVVKFSKDFTVGAFSAVLAKTLCAPIERVKLILQLQNSQSTILKPYNGLIDCLIRVPKEQGVLALWRGNWPNILRASSQESLGLAFKELFRKYTVNDAKKATHYVQFVGGNLLAGGLSGCATFCVIYPLDFARTRLAIDMGKNACSREFHGLSDCLLKITKSDGFLGLYRGFLPSLQFIFLYRSAYYGLFDVLKELHVNKNDDLSFVNAFIIGQIAAFVASMVSYPLDTVRRRLTMDAGKTSHMYNGTIDCTKKIYLNEGTSAFFRGAFVNSIRSIGAALILALYNETSKHL